MEGTIAEIRLFAGNFAPKNWQFCQGQLINISSNTALFSLLGATYGGNGTSNFALPDFRGRVAVGAGAGLGLTPVPLGKMAGEVTHTLALTEMPAHTHAAMLSGTATLAASSANATVSTPANGVSLATPGTGSGRSFVPSFGYDSSSPTVQLNQGSITLGAMTIMNYAAGGSLPHNNMQPYLGLNYIICTQGYFPSRN